MRLLILILLTAALNAGGRAQQVPRKAKVTTAKPKAATKKASSASAKSTAAEPVIIFRKTPCFGTCPHYEATIYPDGRVTYVGYRFVGKIGTYELKLPAATVSRIRQQAQQIGFAQLQARYAPPNVTDLPSTYLSIRQTDGTLKEVQVEEKAPAELQKLLDYVGAAVEKIAPLTAE